MYRVYIGDAEWNAVSFSSVSSLGKYNYRNCGVRAARKKPLLTEGFHKKGAVVVRNIRSAPGGQPGAEQLLFRLSKQAPRQPFLS